MKFILYWILSELEINYNEAYWEVADLSDTFWYLIFGDEDDD